jgi:hypothetical protein
VEEKNYGKFPYANEYFFLCYTFKMSKYLTDWDGLVRFLQQNHLKGLFSFFLRAGSPFKFFIAQILFLIDPFFPGKRIHSFGELLESPTNSDIFLQSLEESNKDE